MNGRGPTWDCAISRNKPVITKLFIICNIFMSYLDKINGYSGSLKSIPKLKCNEINKLNICYVYYIYTMYTTIQKFGICIQ